jgi:hypothetical protein
MTAIEKAKQCVGLHSPLRFCSRLSLFLLTALCRFSEPLLFFKLTS